MRINTPMKAVFLALLVWLGSGGQVSADAAPTGFPRHTNDYVNDFAGVLKPQDRNSIEARFKQLEFQTGIEAVVVTVDSISDYGTADASVETFATNLFNTRGIGHRKANNGVLFLIAVRDRKARIELGGTYGHRYDERMKKILDEVVVPRFKADEMSQGILHGAIAIEKEITIPVSWFEFYKWHLGIGAGIIALILSGIFLEGRGKRGLAWLCFGGVFYLLLALIRMLIFGKSRSGFGSGSSGGGGASADW